MLSMNDISSHIFCFLGSTAGCLGGAIFGGVLGEGIQSNKKYCDSSK